MLIVVSETILAHEGGIVDASKPPWPRDEYFVEISPGRHRAEEIQNPFGFSNAPWIVLQGTLRGGSREKWERLGAELKFE